MFNLIYFASFKKSLQDNSRVKLKFIIRYRYLLVKMSTIKHSTTPPILVATIQQQQRNNAVDRSSPFFRQETQPNVLVAPPPPHKRSRHNQHSSATKSASLSPCASSASSLVIVGANTAHQRNKWTLREHKLISIYISWGEKLELLATTPDGCEPPKCATETELSRGSDSISLSSSGCDSIDRGVQSPLGVQPAEENEDVDEEPVFVQLQPVSRATSKQPLVISSHGFTQSTVRFRYQENWLQTDLSWNFRFKSTFHFIGR